MADPQLPTQAQPAPPFGGGDLAAHLELLCVYLADRCVAATAEQLRLVLRDQLLLSDAPGRLVAWVEGASQSPLRVAGAGNAPRLAEIVPHRQRCHDNSHTALGRRQQAERFFGSPSPPLGGAA
jgi:hypothetical protein